MCVRFAINMHLDHHYFALVPGRGGQLCGTRREMAWSGLIKRRGGAAFCCRNVGVLGGIHTTGIALRRAKNAKVHPNACRSASRLWASSSPCGPPVLSSHSVHVRAHQRRKKLKVIADLSMLCVRLNILFLICASLTCQRFKISSSLPPVGQVICCRHNFTFVFHSFSAAQYHPARRIQSLLKIPHLRRSFRLGDLGVCVGPWNLSHCWSAVHNK